MQSNIYKRDEQGTDAETTERYWWIQVSTCIVQVLCQRSDFRNLKIRSNF